MGNSKQRRRQARKAPGKPNPPPPASTKPEAEDKVVKAKQSRVRSVISWVCSLPHILAHSRFAVILRGIRRVFKGGRWLIWNGLAGLGAMCTIWIALWPHVYMYPLVSLDPNNPMFTPFVIRNDGYLAIRDVRSLCRIKYLGRDGGPLVVAAKPYENEFSDPSQIINMIGPGEEASGLLPLSGMENNQWDNADIAVELQYRPWKWSSRITKERHCFEIKRKGDSWLWCPQPLNRFYQDDEIAQRKP
jgi:hypothetical protein